MTSLTSASRSCISAGVATETIVASTRIMKKPRHSAHRAGHGRTPAGRSELGSVIVGVLIGHGGQGNGPSLIVDAGSAVKRVRAGRLPLKEVVRPGVDAVAPVSGDRWRRSENVDVGRLWPLGALRDLEAHSLVVLQVAEAAALDLRVVGEDVGGAVRRCDEAEPLVGVEPLHG